MTSAAQALQEAITEMEQKYNAAMAYINTMQQEGAKLPGLQSDAAYQQGREYYSTMSGPHPVTHHHTRQSAIDQYNADEKEISDITNKIKGEEAKLNELFKGQFTKLNDALNAMLDAFQKAAFGGGSLSMVAADMAHITDSLNQLFKAYGEKVQSEVYSSEMNSKIADNLTDAQLEELATEANSYQNEELTTLNSLFSSVNTLFGDYLNEEGAAKLDEASDKWAALFGPSARDQETISNAKAMMDGLAGILTAVSQEIGALQPQFAAVINIIQEILKEVKAILADVKLTAAEKQGKMLALVMYLMTFFQVVKQQVATHKADNNQYMTEGSIHANKTVIDQTNLNEKIKEAAERTQATMKIVMLAMQVTMGAIMMIMAPGIGSALMIGMVTAYEAMQTEGVVPDASGALGNAIGSKIGADILIGVGEGALMIGGGALADYGFEQVFAEAVDSTATSAVASVSSEIQEAAEEAAMAAGKAGDPAAITRASDTLTNVAELSAKRAAKETARQFMNQSFGTLVELMVKGTFKQTVQDLMVKASEEAAEISIEDASTIAKLAARGIQSTVEVEEGIAKIGADKAVAKVSEKEASQVTKEADKSVTRKIAIRAITGLVFGLMSSSFLVDSTKKISSADAFAMTMQFLQQIIQMIAMMAGSGMLNASNMEGVISSLPRYANLLNILPEIGQVVGAFSNYETYSVEGKAVTKIDLEGSVANLLHSFLEQLQKDSSINRDIMSRDLEQDGSSTGAIAGHMQDGDRAAIQVLISAV